ECRAVDPLHHHVGVALVAAGVEHGDDVGMGEAGGGAGLVAETVDVVVVGRQLGSQHLHRHFATEAAVPAVVDVGHPAPSSVLAQLVAVVEDPIHKRPSLWGPTVGAMSEHGSRGEQGPRISWENFRTYDAPLATKLRMVVANNLKKARTRSSCCGNHGQPGC